MSAIDMQDKLFDSLTSCLARINHRRMSRSEMLEPYRAQDTAKSQVAARRTMENLRSVSGAGIPIRQVTSLARLH